MKFGGAIVGVCVTFSSCCSLFSSVCDVSEDGLHHLENKFVK